MKDAIRTAIVFLAFAAAASAQTFAGGEFRVNTYTTNYQDSARAAMEPDGDFVVVWESYTQDGSGFGVLGQRFDTSGNRVVEGDETFYVVLVLPHGGVIADGLGQGTIINDDHH